jgi:energy-coupling factor transporter ATP-binding protein EcfA2
VDRATAEALAETLRGAQGKGLVELYRSEIENFTGALPSKEALGAFRVDDSVEPLNLLIIALIRKHPDRFHLAVFGNPREFQYLAPQKVEGDQLVWQYTPAAKGWRAQQQKRAFIATAGALEVRLRFPRRPDEVPELVDELRRVVSAVKASRSAARGDRQDEPGPRAWLFQANPKYFDLAAALENGLREFSWLVRQQAELIRAGDEVFLWQAGKGGGLLARGEILTTPSEIDLSPGEGDFIRDSSAIPTGPALRAQLRVDEVFDEPVSRETLRDDPRTSTAHLLSWTHGTNYRLSPVEANAFRALARGEEPVKALRIGVGSEHEFNTEWITNRLAAVDDAENLGDLRLIPDEASLQRALREAHQAPRSPAERAAELSLVRGLHEGDLVIGTLGTDGVLGIGRVLPPGYRFDSRSAGGRHVVAVDWYDTTARAIRPQQAWEQAVVSRLPGELYRAITRPASQRLRQQVDAGGPSALEHVQSALQKLGLTYSDEILSTYLLALQAKRLVILSGISGTGKTKLAIAMAQALGTSPRAVTVRSAPEGAFEFTTRPSNLRYSRLMVPTRMLSAMRLPDEAAQGGSGLIEVEWPEGRQQLRISTAGPARALLFRGAFKEWFKRELKIGDPYFVQIEDAGEDAPHRLRFGTPQTTFDEEQDEKRYAVIAVRPDWTDNRGLLGYYNPILQAYSQTAFLRLILSAAEEERAAQHEGRDPLPYFAILDEMNLARVEHYFSDFLSALESGEAIELHDDEALEAGENPDAEPIPRSVTVPSNLFFTGTVNVDETTYMFSPKVLDRAFVLELNVVDLEGFGTTGIAGEQDEDEAFRLVGLPSVIRGPSEERRDDWQFLSTLLGGELRRTAIDLHLALERHNRHFGYRVANEMGRFIRLASEQCDRQGDETGARMLWTALDLAALTKVLPKLHGTQQELEPVLASLFAVAVGSDPVDDEPHQAFNGWEQDGGKLVAPANPDLDEPPLPRTALKLYRMHRSLRTRGFASFIE